MFSCKFQRFLLVFLTFIYISGNAQTSTDQKKQDKHAQLKTMIDSRYFQFHALSATSMKGRTVQLSSEYILKMNKDSLDVDLPYYGRSYTADYPGTDVSVRFKSNQFTYSADSTKKGGWEITIIPKNESKANKINLSITSSGYCSMNISSNSRQAISYYGYIKEYDAR
jgi:hypothetical protein